MPVGEEAVLGPRPVFMPQAGDSEARFRAGAEKEGVGRSKNNRSISGLLKAK